MIALLFLSAAEAAPPNVVQNTLSMKKPYLTNTQDHDGYSTGAATSTHDAGNKKDQGANYASVTSTAGPGTGTSQAWANSYLGDTFTIVHSSPYKITCRLTYKGLTGATASTSIFGGTQQAQANVTLSVSVVDKTDGTIVFQKTDVIYEKTTTSDTTKPQEISGSIELSGLITLESNHAYDWLAGILTKTSTYDSGGVFSTEIAEAKANFFDAAKGYQVVVTEVLLEDQDPDNTAPITTASLTGSAGENGWYNASVQVTLTATDSGYGVNQTNRRVTGGSWEPYIGPFTVSTEGTVAIGYYSVDIAQNIETEKTVNVKIDATPPTGSVTINDNAQFTNSTAVTLLAEASDAAEGSGLSEMRFRNEGDNWGQWITYATTPVSWTLDSEYGTKTVYVQFKDNAGLNSLPYNDIISLFEETQSLPSEPKPGNVVIQVKDTNNAPIEGVTVTSTTQPADQDQLSSITNANGTVTFRGVAAGTYIFQATKQPLISGGVQATVRNEETATVTITLQEDTIQPTVSLTVTPANTGLANRVFTVAADDAGGSGIANITLYVDGAPVATWTVAGTYTYSESVYSQGKHTCYAEACDNQGNKARNPATETLEFSVSETTMFEATELWKVVGVVLVLANGAALIYFSQRRKK
jgi:hypothetical protein